MHRKPEYLEEGDQVIIIAPAGRVKEDGLKAAILVLESWGLKVQISKHAEEGFHYFSASDEDRTWDLQNAINSPVYKAVFCARGGYGLTRIIDQIDFSGLRDYPKWFVGFSDVTVLHMALSSYNLQSIHALMPTGFELAHIESIQLLRKVLFGKGCTIEASANTLNRQGKARAPMIGGNLSLLASSIGTKYDLNTDNKILFIEEIDEYLYKIDRMIGQLGRSGKLSNLKGLVVGHMSKMKDTVIPFGCSIEELILDHVENYKYPVLFNAPIGHEPLNLPIVQENVYQLDVGPSEGILRMTI